MGNNGVVSIRVEALGVSITIVDGNIAMEQTKTEIPAATLSKVESPAVASHQALSAGSPASPNSLTVPSPARPLPAVDKRAPPTPKGNSTVQRNLDAGTPVIDELEQAPRRPSPQTSNGPTRLRRDSSKGQEVRSGQTKLVWSGEEVEKLTALFPTHATRAKLHCHTKQGSEFGPQKSALAAGGKTCTEAKVVVRRCDRGLNPRARSKRRSRPWVQQRVAARSSSRAMSLDSL